MKTNFIVHQFPGCVSEDNDHYVTDIVFTMTANHVKHA